MKTNFSAVAVAVASAIILTACGGGGGSTASTAPVVPTPPPVVTPPTPASDLQLTVAAPTYATGSQELAFFNQYNDFRAKLGLGLLAQNAKLDTADKNHLNYIVTNSDVDFSAIDPATGRPYFHLESATRAGFTGVTELDRAKFAQYSGVYVGESGAYGSGNGASAALNDLIGSVYHRAGLMFQFPREMGIAVGTDKFQTMVITFAYQSSQQFNASNYFGAYPADKQTNVPLIAARETPNPFPDLAYTDYATKTSYPVNVVSEASTTLAVTTFTITEAGQTAPIDARLLTKQTDPNKQLAQNTAFLVGKAPFKANTTYNVAFTGTVNGANVTKNWSFTTAAQ